LPVKLAVGLGVIALIAGPVIAFLAIVVQLVGIVVQLVGIVAGLVIIAAVGQDLVHRRQWVLARREAQALTAAAASAQIDAPPTLKRVNAQRLDRAETALPPPGVPARRGRVEQYARRAPARR